MSYICIFFRQMTMNGWIGVGDDYKVTCGKRTMFKHGNSNHCNWPASRESRVTTEKRTLANAWVYTEQFENCSSQEVLQVIQQNSVLHTERGCDYSCGFLKPLESAVLSKNDTSTLGLILRRRIISAASKMTFSASWECTAQFVDLLIAYNSRASMPDWVLDRMSNSSVS